MKPRTKLQRQVVELSSKLPVITDAQIKWAQEHCFPHLGYKCKDEVWCSDCSKMWVVVDEELACNDGSIKCPYCGHKLKINVSRKQKEDEATYMTIVTVIDGFQVIRHIYVNRYARKDKGVHYYSTEVAQQWITDKAEEIVMAKPMNMCSSGWLYSNPLSIKNQYNGWGGYSYNKYAINGYVYPKLKLLPILQRNGLKSSFHDITPSSLITSLINGGISEMLLKTKQYSLLKHLHSKGGISHKWAINICNRNGYIVKDASMWQDYLDLLDYFHLDTHNAKYVCPKNLKAEHDRLYKKKRIIESKRQRERNRVHAINAVKTQRQQIREFYKRMERFFGIMITDGTIIIQPLDSVTQFYQEGKSMHHCVYWYYKRTDCLILSARIGEKRIETIELSLNTFDVVQSRGVCNQNTEYHDRIIGLVKKNIGLIRQKVAV